MIENSDRWHGAEFTIRKKFAEFRLGGEANMLQIESCLKFVQVDMPVGRHYNNVKFLVAEDDYRFSNLPGGQVLYGCQFAGAEGATMSGQTVGM